MAIFIQIFNTCDFSKKLVLLFLVYICFKSSFRVLQFLKVNIRTYGVGLQIFSTFLFNERHIFAHILEELFSALRAVNQQ